MKIALVSTHGGHLTETLQLLDTFEDHEVFFATHHSIRDEEILQIAPAYFSQNIGERSFRFLISFFWALSVLIRENPDLILSLGSEIAIPFLFWAKIFRKKRIYIESWCHVKVLSRTGRIAYWLVDEFWVQWPQLLEVCGSKAKYHGAVI